MKAEKDFEGVIIDCGGKEISLCIEGEKMKRYIIPQDRSECKIFSGLTYEEVNRLLNKYGIYMIAFLYDGKLSEFISRQDSPYPSCRGLNIKNLEDFNPEDAIRIKELFPELFPEYSKNISLEIYA